MNIKLVSMNVRGLQQNDTFNNFIKEIKNWIRYQNIDAFLIQEHNLKPNRIYELEKTLKNNHFKGVFGFAQPNEEDKSCHGGTAIIIHGNTKIKKRK